MHAKDNCTLLSTRSTLKLDEISMLPSVFYERDITKFNGEHKLVKNSTHSYSEKGHKGCVHKKQKRKFKNKNKNNKNWRRDNFFSVK